MSAPFSLKAPRKRAVAYFRHSDREKQENSNEIQRDHAAEFAKRHDLEIIHEEQDKITGLTADRPGFDRLFSQWIISDEAPDFDYILVYDVSRWGRFQDQNEAGYYEHLCTKHGKKVVYVSRGFPKEEQELISHFQTSIERYMAAEYSRQLSEKVFYGSMKVSQQGYSAGGTASYGMSRLLLDESHAPIGPLRPGQRKVIANQRVTFAPAEDETTETVRKIFSAFTGGWSSLESIAQDLNRQGILSPGGFSWDRDKVVRVLTNETYIGTRLYNKTWGRLKQKQRDNPRSEWAIKENAFPAVVSLDQFQRAQEKLYWTISSKWRRGARSILAVRRLLTSQVTTLVGSDNFYDADGQWQVLNAFPAIFAVTFFRDNVPNWCFVIPEQKRRFKQVLAIGVDMYGKEPVEQVFLLENSGFGPGNYLTINLKQIPDGAVSIEREQVQDTVTMLCKSVYALIRYRHLHQMPYKRNLIITL